MPGQAQHRPSLVVSFSLGTKRKASDFGDAKPPQKVSRLCPPIKLEPGSPYENDGTLTVDPLEAQLATEAQLDTSSTGMSVHLRQEAGLDPAGIPRISPEMSEMRIDGLLRPLSVLDNLPNPRQQKDSQRLQTHSRRSTNALEDVAYDSIPDYAPPTSTLPTGDPHILQVHWPEKAVVDLSQDPDRHMLHEAEIKLATSLNLSCAKYLCTKRRIFQARLEALQQGREFRKSDSQKACKINSNKANKICRAFEKVGWFDEKHFLKYLIEGNDLSSKASDETQDIGRSSSELSEPDIWDVSESEFYFTSEGDESSDQDTAGSSVSFGDRNDETQDRTSLEPHAEAFPRKQRHGSSPTGEDVTQRRVCNDGTIQLSDTLSRSDMNDKGPVTKDRKAMRGLLSDKTLYPSKPARVSTGANKDFTVLETRSMTQKLKLVQNNHLVEDKSVGLATIEARNGQHKSAFEESYPRPAPTSSFALRRPIPKSLDEANAVDVMLVKMKEKDRPWPEIEKAWKKQTGKAKTKKSLSHRYARIMENLAGTPLRADQKRAKGHSLTYPRLETADVNGNDATFDPRLSSLKEDQLLRAAEAEIEENYQREKADILAEMESNFQSEKWILVAQAMSRVGPATYSAELVQAQYEKMNNTRDRAVAKDESNRDPSTNLPQRMPRAVRRKTHKVSARSGSGAGRLDKTPNTINLPADGVERRRQAVRKCGPQNHAEHSARMRKVWAKRRALGTDGHRGGPPKASTTAKQAKMALPTIKLNVRNPLAPAITRPSGQAQNSSPYQKQAVNVKDEAGREVNQHKHSLAHIIPAAPVVQSGPRPLSASR